MPFFKHDGHRLAYTVYGEGPRVCVLLPGLLFSQRMHVPLAHELAERGNRVVTLDLLGHGRSDRPDDMRQYSMPLFAEQTVGLLDHLGVEQAVVGGTSLGANVAGLHGRFFGPVAPPQAERQTFDVPTLVIGHPRDPIHPFSDADALAKELPQARLLDADSFFELRFAPERLTGEIAGFLDE